jgi:hypothetical protein
VRVREATTPDEHEEDTFIRRSKQDGEVQRSTPPQLAAPTLHPSGEYPLKTSGESLARGFERRPARLFPTQQMSEIVESEAAFAKRFRMSLSVVCLGLGSGQTPGDRSAIWHVADWLIPHLRQKDLVIEADLNSLMLVLRATNLQGACSLAARVRRLAASGPTLSDASTLDVRAGCASLKCAMHETSGLVLLAQRRFRLARNCEPHPVVGRPVLLVTPSKGSVAGAEPDACAFSGSRLRTRGTNPRATSPLTTSLPTVPVPPTSRMLDVPPPSSDFGCGLVMV